MTTGRYFQTENDNVFLDIIMNDETLELETNIVYCVDKSGSMAGGPMNNVNNVLTQISQISGKDTEIFTYDYNCYDTKLSNVVKTPIIASGSTSFKSVFDRMVKYLTDNITPTTFIFMTDGQDTSGKPAELEESIRIFTMASRAMNKTCPVTVHVIGFGGSVKSDFLEKVRTLGNKEGLFKYSVVAAELQSDFMDMFNLASSQQQIKIKFGGTNFKKTFTGNNLTMFIEKDEVELEDDNDTETVTITNSKGDKINVVVHKTTPNEMDKLKILNLMEPETEEDVKKVLTDLTKIKKSGDFNQKMAVEKMKHDISSRMLEYLDLFNKIKAGQVKEEVKLRLKALKHKATFTNMNAQKKLDLRVNTNTEYFRNTDINGILKGYYDNDITQDKWNQMKTIGDTWKCCYTFDNFYQMMRKSHDNIMCIGIMVDRTEDAIENPSQGLKLVNVSNTIISYDAYIELLTKTREEQLISGDDIYGDFSKTNNAYCIVGATREKINAVIPLYIDEEHMKRIRILEGIWLGHMYTLNSFGYDKNQEIGLLKLLWQFIEQYDGTEYQSIVINEITKVCKFIVTESEGFSNAFGKNTFQNFIETYSGRCLANTRDLEIILIIGFLIDEETLYRTLEAVYEEVIRRRFNELKKTMSYTKNNEIIKELLYGTKQEVIAIRSGRPMEKDDDPDYVEKSFIDYFHDETKMPLQLIGEQSTVTKRKQVKDTEEESLNSFDLSVPKFLSNFIKYIGLNDDWFKRKVDINRIRTNILMGLQYDMLPKNITSSDTLRKCDEHIQGPLKNVVSYNTNTESINIVAQKAIMCKTTEGFSGIVKKYCPLMYNKFFLSITNMLTDESIDVVNREDKLLTLLTSQPLHLDDNLQERYGKLYNGHMQRFVWKPNYEQIKGVKKFLDNDILQNIKNKNYTSHKIHYHEYRLSNIQNRHGYSNLNPNPNYYFRFTSY
jgi:uncharacterized protein with von Willebrand factor type A (vWA) domain